MKLNKIIIAFIWISLPFYLLSCRNGTAKRISISGAFALYPLGVKWAEQYKKLHPDVRFDVSAGGAGKGLTDVLTGATDIGMFSRNLRPSESDKNIWLFAVSKDAVVPTISTQNPYNSLIHAKGLTKAELKEIYLSGTKITWGNVLQTSSKSYISVYTRSDAAGAADTWAAYFGCNQENIKGTGIYGDPGLADAVSKDAYGVGFNNVAYVFDITSGKKRPGIDIIPIDQNENRKIDPIENFYGNADSLLHAIADGRYPSPPGRDLYFITKGKPANPEIVRFLKWILTDGQQYVKAAGYVPLPPEKIREQLNKLK